MHPVNNSFDKPVATHCKRPHSRRKLLGNDALLVKRIHHQSVALEDTHDSVIHNADIVKGSDMVYLAVKHLLNIVTQGAAKKDINELHPSADPKDR